MIICVASFKGGVGKTTTAVHLAAFFQEKGATVLIDGDPNRSATAWAKRGSLPFPVIDERQTAKLGRGYVHTVIDTEARPDPADLEVLVGGCDLLVIPSTPDALALDALRLTLAALRDLRADNYRVLLTVIPPRPNRDGEEARAMLKAAQVPLFKTGIRRFTAYQKAALIGSPVCDVRDPRGREAWADYVAVGREVLRS